MNAIRQTALLNKRELENAVPPSASWHVDYRDTAWLYVGGLPLDLSEGDVVTIFSQYGNPTHINLIREKDTGKMKGFGFLKYEDQRSCDLAVDNLGGADVLGRLLRVDHTRYKRKEGEDEETYRIDRLEAESSGQNENGKRASDTDDDSENERRVKKKRKMLREEKELEDMLAITHDAEEADPMREYLIKERREEVERAKERQEKKRKHRHRHQHRDENGDHDEETRRRHKHRRRDDSRGNDRNDERGPHRSGKDHESRTRRRGDDRDDREKRRSSSKDRKDVRRERKRQDDSRSPSLDAPRRRRKEPSSSPRRRSRYDVQD